MPTLDFSEYISEHAQDFTGRDWVFSQVNEWLSDSDAPNFFIITGEPGIGKSAIAARFVQRREVNAYHFCIARDLRTINPKTFSESISSQLADIAEFATHVLVENGIHIHISQKINKNMAPVYGAHISGISLQAPSASVAFQQLVLNPLVQLYKTGYQKQILILVDSLDEAIQYTGNETIIDLITNSGKLPNYVRLLLTSRPESLALQHFEQRDIPYLLINAKHKQNMADVRSYVWKQVRRRSKIRSEIKKIKATLDNFVGQISLSSKGNFLYLVWMLNDIENGNYHFDNLNNFPLGLDSVYRHFLRNRKIGKNVNEWRRKYRPVLSVITVAYEPLSITQISSFSGIYHQIVSDILVDLQQFFDPILLGQGKYEIYHQSIKDFLTHKDWSQEFWIDPVYAHALISDSISSLYHSENGQISDDYILKYMIVHVLKAGQQETGISLVRDARWWKNKHKWDASGLSFARDLELLLEWLDTKLSQILQHDNTQRSETCHKNLHREILKYLPNLMSLSLMFTAVGDLSHNAPIEAIAGIAHLGNIQEAIDRATLINNRTSTAGDEISSSFLGQNHLIGFSIRAEVHRRIAIECLAEYQRTGDQYYQKLIRYLLEIVTSEILKNHPGSDELDGFENQLKHVCDLLAESKMSVEIETLLTSLYDPSSNQELIEYGLISLVKANAPDSAIKYVEGVEFSVFSLYLYCAIYTQAAQQLMTHWYVYASDHTKRWIEATISDCDYQEELKQYAKFTIEYIYLLKMELLSSEHSTNSICQYIDSIQLTSNLVYRSDMDENNLELSSRIRLAKNLLRNNKALSGYTLLHQLYHIAAEKKLLPSDADSVSYKYKLAYELLTNNKFPEIALLFIEDEDYRYSDNMLSVASWLSAIASVLESLDKQSEVETLVGVIIKLLGAFDYSNWGAYGNGLVEDVAPIIKNLCALNTPWSVQDLISELNHINHGGYQDIDARLTSVIVENLINKVDLAVLVTMLEVSVKQAQSNRRNDYRIAAIGRVAISFARLGNFTRGKELLSFAIDDLWNTLVRQHDPEHDLHLAFGSLCYAASQLDDLQLIEKLLIMFNGIVDAFRSRHRVRYYDTIANALVDSQEYDLAWHILERVYKKDLVKLTENIRQSRYLHIPGSLDNSSFTKLLLSVKDLQESDVDILILQSLKSRWTRDEIDQLIELATYQNENSQIPRLLGNYYDSSELSNMTRDELQHEIELSRVKSNSLGMHARQLIIIAQAFANLNDVSGLDLVIQAARFSEYEIWKDWDDVWAACRAEVCAYIAEFLVRCGEIKQARKLVGEFSDNHAISGIVDRLVFAIEDTEQWSEALWIKELSERVSEPLYREYSQRRTSHLLAKAGLSSQAWDTALDAYAQAIEAMSTHEPFMFLCLCETSSGLKHLVSSDPSEALNFVYKAVKLARPLPKASALAVISSLFPLLVKLDYPGLVGATWKDCDSVDLLWQAQVKEIAERYQMLDEFML